MRLIPLRSFPQYALAIPYDRMVATILERLIVDTANGRVQCSRFRSDVAAFLARNKQASGDLFDIIMAVIERDLQDRRLNPHERAIFEICDNYLDRYIGFMYDQRIYNGPVPNDRIDDLIMVGRDLAAEIDETYRIIQDGWARMERDPRQYGGYDNRYGGYNDRNRYGNQYDRYGVSGRGYRGDEVGATEPVGGSMFSSRPVQESQRRYRDVDHRSEVYQEQQRQAESRSTYRSGNYYEQEGLKLARIIEEATAANKADNKQEEQETEKEVVQETVRPRYSKPVEVREPEPVDTDYLFEDDFDDDVSEAYDIDQPQRVEEEDDDAWKKVFTDRPRDAARYDGVVVQRRSRKCVVVDESDASSREKHDYVQAVVNSEKQHENMLKREEANIFGGDKKEVPAFNVNWTQPVDDDEFALAHQGATHPIRDPEHFKEQRLAALPHGVYPINMLDITWDKETKTGMVKFKFEGKEEDDYFVIAQNAFKGRPYVYSSKNSIAYLVVDEDGLIEMKVKRKEDADMDINAHRIPRDEHRIVNPYADIESANKVDTAQALVDLSLTEEEREEQRLKLVANGEAVPNITVVELEPVVMDSISSLRDTMINEKLSHAPEAVIAYGEVTVPDMVYTYSNIDEYRQASHKATTVREMRELVDKMDKLPGSHLFMKRLTDKIDDGYNMLLTMFGIKDVEVTEALKEHDEVVRRGYIPISDVEHFNDLWLSILRNVIGNIHFGDMSDEAKSKFISLGNITQVYVINQTMADMHWMDLSSGTLSPTNPWRFINKDSGLDEVYSIIQCAEAKADRAWYIPFYIITIDGVVVEVHAVEGDEGVYMVRYV
jgi:hypothetical protein|nr:MAG TPA: hypothetical protein [Caudoviricetes sp.]